ncbi:MAG: hypothetical protein JO301_16925 [Chitinophagaceae bacterium]|nr:hypothetical protein [Chitinophagaceae bacterium]
MKKAIIIAIAVMFTTAVNAQKKDTANLKFSTNSNTAAFLKSGSDTLEITVPGTVKHIKLGDRVFSVDQLTQTLPLFVSLDWIVAQFTYLRTSKNGEFTDAQMDQLKAPLLPYVQAWQQMQRSQQPAKQ